MAFTCLKPRVRKNVTMRLMLKAALGRPLCLQSGWNGARIFISSCRLLHCRSGKSPYIPNHSAHTTVRKIAFNFQNSNRRFLHYSKEVNAKIPAAVFFDCISDIDRYSTFVPYCSLSEVVWRSPDGMSMLADMGIGFVHFNERYRSRVLLEKDPPNYLITATAIDSSLFSCMDSRWNVHGTGPLNTDVTFRIDMEPASKLHALAMQFVFEDVARQQLNAFIRKCLLMMKPAETLPAVDEVDFRTTIRSIISLIPSSNAVRGEFSREIFVFYSQLLDRYQKATFTFDNFVEICREIARNEDIDLMHRYAFLSISEDIEIAACSWELLCPEESREFVSRLDFLVSLYFLTDDYILDRTVFYLVRMFSNQLKPSFEFAAANRKIFKLQLKMLRHVLPSFIFRVVQPLSGKLRDSREITRLIGVYGTMEDMLQKLDVEMEGLICDVSFQCGQQKLDARTWMQYLADHRALIKNASIKEFLSHLTMALSNINHIR